MEPSDQQHAEGESAQPKDLFDAITSTLFAGPELVEGISSALDSFTKAAANATFRSSIGYQVKETLNVLNTYSESSVHVAVRLCQDNMLQLALDNGANDKTLFEHAYPIHMCMKYQTVECARVLLRADYENLRLKDTKYQGTPLHWAKTPESIDLLLEYNADINAKSDTGETPLHIMIKRNRLDCMIALASSGADLNLRGEEGRSPLHYAVQVGNVHMVKGLLLLGAEPALRDEKGQTPLSIAHEMKEEHFHVAEIINAFELFTDTDKGSMSKISWETLTDTGVAPSDSLQQILRKESADFNGSKDVLVDDLQRPSMSILKQKRDQEAILCLDGGGIRGIILAELLSAIENATGQPARNLFDWISGTSTGSYMALAVAAGKSIDHCLRAYFRLKRKVFKGSRPYSAEALEDFLIEEFGEETRMDSIKHPKVVIPAVLVDRKPAALHFFRTFDAPYDEQYVMRDARFPRPKRAADQTLWASTRCSGAAPTYFRSMGRFLDGGLMANNPTLDILSEVHKYRKHGDGKLKGNVQYSSASRSVAHTSESNCTNTRNGMGVLISLGTGKPPLEQVTGIDIFKPSSIWDTTKVIEGAKLLGELIVDQVANSDGHVVERAKSWCEMIGLPYFRLSPPLSSNILLDEQDDKVLIQMLWETRQYIRQNYAVIMKAGRILLGLEVQM